MKMKIDDEYLSTGLLLGGTWIFPCEPSLRWRWRVLGWEVQSGSEYDLLHDGWTSACGHDQVPYGCLELYSVSLWDSVRIMSLTDLPCVTFRQIDLNLTNLPTIGWISMNRWDLPVEFVQIKLG
jgi:hypothetical protein